MSRIVADYLFLSVAVMALLGPYAVHQVRRRGLTMGPRDWLGLGSGMLVWWLLWSLPLLGAWALLSHLSAGACRAALFAGLTLGWVHAHRRVSIVLRVARWMERAGTRDLTNPADRANVTAAGYEARN